jgi:guanylate kinase
MTRFSGQLVIISGPSGAGKSTVLQRLLAECPLPLRMSVSATTRPRRPGERDGVDYHFLTPDQFARRRRQGAFLECKEVFRLGHWYGTLRSEVQAGLADGQFVVLEIDVEGALSVLEQCPQAITIFLHPGSVGELEHRLRARGTENPASLARRLEVARRELKLIDRYQYEVVNRTVDQAAGEICDILRHSGHHSGEQ